MTRAGMDALDAILSRRSTGRLTEPAPAGDDLTRILEAAAAAPDHGELRPFRFVLLAGPEKEAFGQVLADTYLARCEAVGATPTPGQLEKERTKLGRAPLVLVVGAVHSDDEVIPWVEQEAAAVAAAENALIAATALGYGSMWRTGDPVYDQRVKGALGFGPHDAVVAFLYLGTLHEGEPKPSRRPDLEGLVTWWEPPAAPA
ncbi:MAG: nitroreductase family protein [Acidimicrobiales bacterium]